jgi:hypothetical protein
MFVWNLGNLPVSHVWYIKKEILLNSECLLKSGDCSCGF